MTEHERQQEFPIHIELGKESDFPSFGEDKKSNKKTMYPTLFIGGIKGLEKLPKEGCMLIDFKRRSMTINNVKGESTCSVELECRTICLPEEYEDNDSADDIVDDLYKKSRKKSRKDDDDEYEEDDED